MRIKAIALMLALSVIGTFFTEHGSVEAAKKYAVLHEETNRSYVPIRYIGETFGYKVDWHSEQKRVTISQNGFALELTLNNIKANVNGTEKLLDAVPMSIGGSVYVPLRFVAEQFGTEVNPIEKNRVKLKSDTLEAIIETVPLKRFQQALNNPVVTSKAKIEGANKAITLNTVYIDLYHPSLAIDAYYANDKIGSVEPFKNMVEKAKAKVAVNGTFFNAYSDTAVKIPYGYIIKNGETINKAPTEKRAVFVYTKDFQVKVVDVNEFNKLYDEKNIETAIQAGPLLVKKGEVVVDPVAEGFKDPKILTSRGARSAIGITKDNKLLIATTSAASIPELAEAMLKLNVVEAMNLDGGASSALYANQTYITPAGRELSNILTIH